VDRSELTLYRRDPVDADVVLRSEAPAERSRKKKREPVLKTRASAKPRIGLRE
jgi:hypothetical protein